MLTREELIAESQIGWREWSEAIEGVSRREMNKAEISRGWSLKDVVGHLATYIRLNVRHVEAYQKRGKIVSMRAKNWYQFNKRQVKKLKQEPLGKLEKELRTAYVDLMSLLPNLTDADLKAPFPSPWSPKSGRFVKLGTILRADVSRHLHEHARDVRKWRERENR